MLDCISTKDFNVIKQFVLIDLLLNG